VWGAFKERVDQFRATLPLIMDLRNPAMRSRHWDQLKTEIGKTFDPQGESFTLEKVFSLGLNLHAEFIGEMSASANKELAIENALEDIEKAWQTIDIDMAEFKEIYYKIRSTEDLFLQLEDNQVQLSTMKASKFFTSFEEKITYWEKALNSISEVIEMTTGVQRQWMYLESIFMASEDIQKQLPTETKLFLEVNESYKDITGNMFRFPNALKACQREGVLEELMKTDQKLETIQKSLDQYLETKRMFFPRFYFLSNDDLLEILGQQKDPEKVQKHIKKCFEGIKTLQLIQPGAMGNPTIEAIGMNSPKGEKVPLNRNVVVDGPVEGWLVKIEEMMQLSIQKWTQKSMVEVKKEKGCMDQELSGAAAHYNRSNRVDCRLRKGLAAGCCREKVRVEASQEKASEIFEYACGYGPGELIKAKPT
jgi:dynein heavy chain